MVVESKSLECDGDPSEMKSLLLKRLRRNDAHNTLNKMSGLQGAKLKAVLGNETAKKPTEGEHCPGWATSVILTIPNMRNMPSAAVCREIRKPKT